MLAKLPEWKCRQKVKRRICDGDPETLSECFQVSVNIIEAKNLAWASSRTGDKYVVVTLGKEKYKTILKQSEENYYSKEYILFKWFTTLDNIQRSNLSMTVIEPRCCAPPRLIGETNIDLGVIWAQPNHQVFHKWAQLTLPRNLTAGIVGFLKVDISIMTRAIQVMPVMVNKEEHKDILQSSFEQQTANYVIYIFNAFGITSRSLGSRQDKLPSTCVKVTFCGISVNTAVQMRTSNPSYCERVSIAGIFPSICQTIRLEVCTVEHTLNPVLASVDLNLGLVSHGGENGFVPTFGPSLLHMYGNSMLGIENPCGEGPYYRGALLVGLKTIVPYLQEGGQMTNVEPTTPIQMEKLWAWHDYYIFCPIFEVSMLNRQLAGKRCGVAITLGEIPCEPSIHEDFISLKKEIKKRKLHYTGPVHIANSTDIFGRLDFADSIPVLQHATRLPGFRFRIYRNNLVQKIADNLENALIDVENRLNDYASQKPNEILEDLCQAMNATADQILRFFENVDCFHSSAESISKATCPYVTELDQKQLDLQREELEKIYHQIREKINLNSAVNLMKMVNKASSECYSISKKHVKLLMVEATGFFLMLKALVFKPMRCQKHLAVTPNSCTCNVGKIELMLWAGLYSEAASFETFVPRGLRTKTIEYNMCIKAPVIMVKIRVFIFRAKLIVNENKTHPSTYVRVNALSSVRETQVHEPSSTPVWDQVLTVTSMIRSSHDRIVISPPEILVEVYNYDSSNNCELLGRSKINPAILSIEYAPQLKWHALLVGTENVGEILMSASIVQMPETLVKSTIYSSLNEINDTNFYQNVDNESEKEIIEKLPMSVKPKYCSYKIDVYWWGLRDLSISRKPCAILEIDSLAIKSNVIAEKKSNCNFSNGRISQTFEGSLNCAYTSPLTIRLYDSSSFGRTIYFGTNTVKNPTKYLVDWIPKCDRDSSIKTASISSSEFFKVSRSLYIKKHVTPSVTLSECSKITISSIMIDKKVSKWKSLFCKEEPEEEKCVLLPVKVNQKNLTENLNAENEHLDWWSRFFYCQKDRDSDKSGRKIKIYNYELERQPEFAKFKDWCQTLKLYEGKKTGIPDKDEKLRRGVLKVGIAIYRWPPPPHTVAVNCSGVELDKGFFNDFPCNDPRKFQVRAYIVRALNLTSENYNDVCNSFVVIKCGVKQFGDRSQFIKNTTNPIFGKFYEFHCSLPEDYLMTVSVYNHDKDANDTLIGSTDIDLENRIYSKHRAQVGIASEYCVTGPTKWRDYEKPSDILSKLCAKNYMPPPIYPDGNTVIVNGVEYREGDRSYKTYISATERKENLCLNLLHKWHTLPLYGYHLVPEHVETRSLINPEKPTVDQGKILMWIDIFPIEAGAFIPLPVDITPRKVEDYELRAIIWHVQSLGSGRLSSKQGLDLYVKAWIGNVEQAHYTDIHYNSMNGEASFNWRMVFNFQYQLSDNKLIKLDKGPFTEYEERIPPILIVQVADSDADSIEDYLATLMLDLSAIPRGSKEIINRASDNMENARKINLFSARSLRSWWPLKTIDQDSGAVKFEGMIDMELHLLPKEKAVLLPVGIGRDPPFPLPMPNRPEPTKFRASTLENMLSRGGAEYIVIGVLLTLLIVAFGWHLPVSLDKLPFYY